MDNNTSSLEKLEIWNRDLAENLMFDNVVLSLYILIGLLGNSIVIIVYGFLMKGDKEERYFIPILAAVDLCTCLLGSSFGIALNMMPVKFDNNFACKTMKFLVPFFVFTSVLFLLIIAVHRYRKVCKPFGKQMTKKWKQFSICFAAIIGLTLSLPMLYFYDSVSFPNKKEGIVGLQCSTSKTVNKTLSLIHGGFLLIATITIIISLIILYSKIGYTIMLHFNKTKTINRKKNCSDEENSIGIYKLENQISSHDDQHSENKTYSVKTDSTELSGNDSISQVHVSSSTTKKVILLLLEARNPKFWEELSDSTRVGVLFVYRMYIINSIANPVIYAFLDKKFATEIKKLFNIFSQTFKMEKWKTEHEKNGEVKVHRRAVQFDFYVDYALKDFE
ncbi:cholecystokinin receptor type A-like [Saccostrea cucullata]|uniref:cholecystokinin receptor type A-like n=1 Tax=Saccostrea cuccullata TaxID=36930 RepID=UPI002ED3BC88